MNAAVKWGMTAVLTALSAGYFGVVLWRADLLSRLLLRRGWEARGWTEPRLTLLLRVLGGAGLALSLAGLAVSIARIVG
jgi:hypothetical protein